MPPENKALRLSFKPLTPQTWDDFVRLFGPRGACGGCWCMWWRRKRSDFERHKGAGNRRAMKRIVDAGEVPGIIAYHRTDPIGWCAIAPRQRYSVLARSRVLKPVDDQPVWSVVCFFVRREFRRRGVSEQLLEAAVRFARKNKAGIVEGYPVQPRTDSMPDAFAWTGLAGMFQSAGFEEIARRSETRPIMRRSVST